MITSRRVAHRWLMGVLVLILPALSMVALALRPRSPAVGEAAEPLFAAQQRGWPEHTAAGGR